MIFTHPRAWSHHGEWNACFLQEQPWTALRKTPAALSERGEEAKCCAKRTRIRRPWGDHSSTAAPCWLGIRWTSQKKNCTLAWQSASTSRSGAGRRNNLPIRMSAKNTKIVTVTVPSSVSLIFSTRAVRELRPLSSRTALVLKISSSFITFLWGPTLFFW